MRGDGTTQDIVQYLPSMQEADAIGNYVLLLDGVFARMGLRPHIRALRGKIAPALSARCLPVEDAPVPEGALHFYHFSTGSEMTGRFMRASGRRMLCYHNVTPPGMLAGFNFEAAARQREGLAELKAMAARTAVALAVSEFNRTDLVRAGYALTGFIPYAFSPLVTGEKTSAAADPTLLFVGRLSPHKKIEDLLRTLAVYRKAHEPGAPLVVAGSWAGMERYRAFLDATSKELGLDGGGAVEFTGRVSDAELASLYRKADVFVCMSEHEGICIPIVEAMAAGIPVVAYSAAGVPETMAGAGMEFFRKDIALVAGLIDRAVRDARLRAALIAGQKRGLGRYSPEHLERTLAQNWPQWAGTSA